MPQADISELIGKTFTSIEGMESGSDEIRFQDSSDDGYIFFHQQNCCERVSVYEVIGDPADLVGSPILRAEERSSDEDPAGYQVPAYRESYTWTFYEFATIKGSEFPDQWTLFGNHHDAWVHGADDPLSGVSAQLETARSLATLTRQGWKPKRTILLCSWDAEEYGLVGSTEWAEDNAAMLKKAVAYLNIDSAVTGAAFGASGTASLRDVLRDVVDLVPEPKQGGTVGALWAQRQKASWAQSTPVNLGGANKEFDLQLSRLGSGSDYTVFLDALGIPSTDLGFSGSYGVYHSVYDNFRWMSLYGDPEFIYHQAAARVMGLLAMRIASADIAPLRFGGYARALGDDGAMLQHAGRAQHHGEADQEPCCCPGHVTHLSLSLNSRLSRCRSSGATS